MPDTQRQTELRAALTKRLQLIDEGSQKAIKVEGENVTVSSEDFAYMQKMMQEAEEIKGLIQAEMFGEETKRWLAAPISDSAAMEQNALAPFLQGQKSLAQMFTESQQFKDLVASGGATMPVPFEANVYDVTRMGTQFKDVYTGAVPGLTTRGFGSVQTDPTVPRAQRTNRVRDLFPTAATNANLIDYFKVTGFAENGGAGNAQPVAERDTSVTPNVFAAKPKSNLQFTSAQAPVRTVAHWEAAHRNVLADEPQLQSTINNELLYGLALEEDSQILAGTGANEDLLGILNTPDIQAYTQANDAATPPVATETKPDAVRRAATRVMIANYDPTGVVLHPFDWEDIELTKTTQGSYVLTTNVAVGAEQRLWRLPVVATAAIAEGTFLAGAFGLGAQLYDRQIATIRIAEQHSDFFVRNAIAILAEERLALAVKRPESFVKGTFIG